MIAKELKRSKSPLGPIPWMFPHGDMSGLGFARHAITLKENNRTSAIIAGDKQPEPASSLEFGHDNLDGPVVGDEDVIADLGALPAGAILTKDALAKIFCRKPISIDRAVLRKELPRPAKLLGRERWTAGAILKHFEKRMDEAAEDAAEIERQSI